MTSAARQPFLLGTIGAVIGIVLALVVFGGFGGGSASASASPTTAAVASAGASASATTVESGAPTAEASDAPATSEPTAPPTTAPTAAPTAKPTPNTNPQIVTFEVPSQEDCTGSTAGSVHLKWSVKNATGVTISIDGPGVYKPYPGLTNEDDVPFGCGNPENTYTLTTVGGTGPAATITKTVKRRAPSITAFALDKVTECAGSTGQATLRLSYTVRAATGADLYFRGEGTATFNVYANYSGKEVGPVSIPYYCEYDTITYKLVTTGGYGDPASKTIKVTRP